MSYVACPLFFPNLVVERDDMHVKLMYMWDSMHMHTHACMYMYIIAMQHYVCFIMSISVARDVGTCQMLPVNMGMYEKRFLWNGLILTHIHFLCIYIVGGCKIFII